MLKNIDSQTLVEQIQYRQEVYHAICEPNWREVCSTIDTLLKIGTQESWETIENLLKRKELQIYEAFFNEWIMLMLAIEIYKKEKIHHVSEVILCGIDGIEQLDRKLNCLKFGLLRLEYQIPVDMEFEQEWKRERFSDIAIVEMARRVCKDADSVLKQLGIQEQ